MEVMVKSIKEVLEEANCEKVFDDWLVILIADKLAEVKYYAWLLEEYIKIMWDGNEM